MKEKLQAALEQRYGGAIGSKNKLHEEVAAAYGNLITSEEQIPAIVAGVEPLFKTFQSVNDRLRSFENRQKEEVKPTPSEPAPNPNNEPPKPDPQPQPDFKAMFAEALAEVVNPLKEELSQFKAEQGAKAALANAEATFKSNDYVKKYTDEATDAWERTTEMYEATGKSWTAEQLQEKAMNYFNKAVGRKGVDTSKPFPSDGGGGNPDEANKAFADEIRKALGKDKEQ